MVEAPRSLGPGGVLGDRGDQGGRVDAGVLPERPILGRGRGVEHGGGNRRSRRPVDAPPRTGRAPPCPPGRRRSWLREGQACRARLGSGRSGRHDAEGGATTEAGADDRGEDEGDDPSTGRARQPRGPWHPGLARDSGRAAATERRRDDPGRDGHRGAPRSAAAPTGGHGRVVMRPASGAASGRWHDSWVAPLVTGPAGTRDLSYHDRTLAARLRHGPRTVPSPTYSVLDPIRRDPSQPTTRAAGAIVVSGTGRVAVPPDVADLRLGVAVTGRPSRRHAARPRRRWPRSSAVDAAGASPEDVRTALLSVQPRYDYREDRPPA